MKVTALFRADGSRHLGLGHIMRCLAFAQGLEIAGLKSTFITRDFEPKVPEVIRNYGYDVSPIPANLSMAADMSLTLELASSQGAAIIITDLCNTDILENQAGYGEYLQGLKDSGRFLITIDDLNKMPFPSDILINPNYGASAADYKSSRSTRLLLGPAYFLFRQEFVRAARIDREIKKNARNILVTMGGSDALNLNEKVVRALTQLSGVDKLHLRIVLGINCTGPKEQELSDILQDFAGEYSLIRQSDDIANLLLWSDLAITGGGLTKYEAAITGTPSIIIAQVAHQADLAGEFQKEGTAQYLGLGDAVSEADIAGAVSNLLANDTLRIIMSGKGKKLVDGSGIDRIISAIPGEVLL